MYFIPELENMHDVEDIAIRMLDAASKENVTAEDGKLLIYSEVQDVFGIPSNYTLDRLKVKWIKSSRSSMECLQQLLKKTTNGLQIHVGKDTVIVSKIYSSAEGVQLQKRAFPLYDVLLFAELDNWPHKIGSISEFNHVMKHTISKPKEIIERYLLAFLSHGDDLLLNQLDEEVKDYVACRKGRYVDFRVKVDTCPAAYPLPYVLFKALHHKNSITDLRQKVYRKLDRELLFKCKSASVKDEPSVATYPFCRLTLELEKEQRHLCFGTALARALVQESVFDVAVGRDAHNVLQMAKI